jgi:protein arginine kinase activator
MLCQICKKKQATIHLTEITDGKRKEMHLCQKCAADEGMVVKSQMSIDELLGNLLESKPDDEAQFDSEDRCPICGFHPNDLNKQPLVGCPNDYEVFEPQLSAIIENAHDGKTHHTGKIPSNIPQNTKSYMQLLNLREELRDALKHEDYEQAAELRDRITELEEN